MDLFHWFMRQAKPVDPELERMIELVLTRLAR
jgi:succinate dehydrogenase flavin-adding protein (antitoxin of CptAB toxin-antitoxin module)